MPCVDQCRPNDDEHVGLLLVDCGYFFFVLGNFGLGRDLLFRVGPFFFVRGTIGASHYVIVARSPRNVAFPNLGEFVG